MTGSPSRGPNELMRVGPLPLAAERGRLRLPDPEPICHGYANACICPDCDAREREQANPPRQPWEPRTGPQLHAADEQPDDWPAWDDETDDNLEAA